MTGQILSIPEGNPPPATLYRLLLSGLRARTTLPSPVAMHPMQRSTVYYCLACLRAFI